MEIFTRREDNQIAGLELLAIALGLSTFGEVLAGRRVCVWSDNTVSEHGTRKGSARSWDHASLVHCLWTKAAKLGIDLQVERVPSDDNIADLPSREEYCLLRSLGAVFEEPLLDKDFWDPSSWEALSLRKVFG